MNKSKVINHTACQKDSETEFLQLIIKKHEKGWFQYILVLQFKGLNIHMKKILKPVKTSSVDISNWILTDAYVVQLTLIITNIIFISRQESYWISTFTLCNWHYHNKHYIYIKTVKFLNQHLHITLEMVCNICMYHLRARLTAL